MGKIIRPAYMAVQPRREDIPLENRRQTRIPGKAGGLSKP